MRQVKVLIVEDSLVFSELMVKSLSEDPAINVVAIAKDPYEARDAIIAHKPDVMTLDIELPKMDGIEFLRKLIPQYPIPAVVISALSDRVFDALQAGAVDFVAKPMPDKPQQLETFLKNELPVKIKIASTVQVGNIRRLLQYQTTADFSEEKEERLIAIGASTGGPEAIASILKELNADIPGTVMVQHMPAGFTEMYAKRLDRQCRVRVKEAVDGDRVLPGQVLLAPGGDKQMKVIKGPMGYQVEVKNGPKVSGHCPSVDVLFRSVANAAGNQGIGILLTGMGADGAEGLLAMRKAGAVTIGQDESTCVVYGMPKVAYDNGAVQYQEKLPDIAQKIYSLL